LISLFTCAAISFKTPDVPEGWLRVGGTQRRKEKVVGRELEGRISCICQDPKQIFHTKWHCLHQNQTGKAPGEAAP